MLGCIIVTYFYFPETKGRTPAELDEMFEARIPARQFKSMYSRLAHIRNWLTKFLADYVCRANIDTYMGEHKAGMSVTEIEKA